jgi:hypothetical protein
MLPDAVRRRSDVCRRAAADTCEWHRSMTTGLFASGMAISWALEPRRGVLWRRRQYDGLATRRGGRVTSAAGAVRVGVSHIQAATGRRRILSGALVAAWAARIHRWQQNQAEGEIVHQTARRA